MHALNAYSYNNGNMNILAGWVCLVITSTPLSSAARFAAASAPTWPGCGGLNAPPITRMARLPDRARWSSPSGVPSLDRPGASHVRTSRSISVSQLSSPTSSTCASACGGAPPGPTSWSAPSRAADPDSGSGAALARRCLPAESSARTCSSVLPSKFWPFQLLGVCAFGSSGPSLRWAANVIQLGMHTQDKIAARIIPFSA